jgi:hypothetical protein
MWSTPKLKELIMSLTKIAAVIGMATLTTGAFAASSSMDGRTDGDRGANRSFSGNTSAQTDMERSQAINAENSRWYESGNRVVQSEKERAQLDRAGFPQYNQ